FFSSDFQIREFFKRILTSDLLLKLQNAEKSTLTMLKRLHVILFQEEHSKNSWRCKEKHSLDKIKEILLIEDMGQVRQGSR
ncbi:hypothetical protein VIGAN_01516600, partial [Vigna angularis var. angularis]